MSYVRNEFVKPLAFQPLLKGRAIQLRIASLSQTNVMDYILQFLLKLCPSQSYLVSHHLTHKTIWYHPTSEDNLESGVEIVDFSHCVRL